MSDLSQWLHSLFNNERVAAPAGVLQAAGRPAGTLGTILSIPGNMIHGYLEQWRQIGPAWDAYHERQRRMREWEQQDPRTRGPQPDPLPPPDPNYMQGQNVPVDTGGNATIPTLPPPPAPSGQGVRQPGFRDMANYLASQPGLPAAQQAAILDRAQPNMQVDQASGTPYDQNDPSSLPPRFERRTAINGWNIDPYAPGNTQQFFPNAPVNGAVPVQGPRGMSWALPEGTTSAIAQTAGAESGARSANTITSGTDSQGRPVQGYAGSIYGPPPGVPGGQGAAGVGVGGGPMVGQSPGDLEYQRQQATAAAARYGTIQTAGTEAQGRINDLRTIGSLLQDFNGNRLSPTGLEINRYIQSSPLLARLFPNSEAMTNAEAAQAIGNRLALEARSTAGGAGMPGSMSNQDRNFLVNMNPNLAQTAQGRSTLIQYQIAVSQRQLDVARMARQWQQRYGRIDAPDPTGHSFDDYLQIYADRNPLFVQRPRGR